MKTTLKIILALTWIILLSLIWANMDRLWLQIILTLVWIFIPWIANEAVIGIKNEKDYKNDLP